MDNVITMRLKDDEQKEIAFESNPTVYELVAAKLILEEVLERNFGNVNFSVFTKFCNIILTGDKLWNVQRRLS